MDLYVSDEKLVVLKLNKKYFCLHASLCITICLHGEHLQKRPEFFSPWALLPQCLCIPFAKCAFFADSPVILYFCLVLNKINWESITSVDVKHAKSCWHRLEVPTVLGSKFDASEGHLKFAKFNFSPHCQPFYAVLAALLYSFYLRKI